MAKLTLYLDTRRVKENGEYPVRLRVYHHKAFFVSLNISARAEHWRGGEFSPKAPNFRARNVQLRDQLNKVERFLFDNADEVAFLSDKQLKARIEGVLSITPQKSTTLLSYMLRAREGLSPRTQALYKWAADKVIAYDAQVPVSGVTDAWLKGFEKFLKNQGLKPNSIVLLMAYISRGVQCAVADGSIARRPYSAIRAKGEPTRKRNLTLEQMRYLRDLPLTGKPAFCRDMFFLSFYLIGMNVADMYALREVRRGRVEYRRRKTGTLYDVAVPPEAMAIIERWRAMPAADGAPPVRLIDWQGWGNNGTACTGITWALGRMIPGLSTYYARHTWASFAAELEIPIETISHALGHQIGSPTTAIYVAFNQKKVDAANRQVIEYLNGDKMKEEQPR